MKKLLSILLLFLAFTLYSCVTTDTKEQTESKDPIQENPLPSWSETTRARIIKYVSTTTTIGSEGFIPETDRIAVFDNDGTLWTEQPMPNQIAYALDMVKALDTIPEDLANSEAIQAVRNGDMEALKASGMKGLSDIAAVSHANIAVEDFDASVLEWISTTRENKFQKTYIELVYQPMLELLDYLRDHGFKTFIVSGGGADFMRVWAEDVYGIKPYEVIGSYSDVVYEIKDGKPRLTKSLEGLYFDDKTAKPQAIRRFIGKQPVVCFGNSDGDQAMMQYTHAHPDYPTLCGIIWHTDGEREYEYQLETLSGHLETALDEAKEKNWMVVDMKNDWKKVFPFE
jgi:phosphoglycolate phosphatase-like HAD superfamily hydrolase